MTGKKETHTIDGQFAKQVVESYTLNGEQRQQLLQRKIDRARAMIEARAKCPKYNKS